MSTRAWAIAAASLLAVGLAGYGFGRYVQPARVVVETVVRTETNIDWKDRVVEHRVEGPVRTVIRTVERTGPCEAGTAPTSESIITIDEGPDTTDTVTDSTGTASAATKVETRTVTVYTQPRLMLQAGVAAGLDLRPTYSLGASYRIVGPLWLGAAYLHGSRPQIDLRASLTF